ncbi:beta-lactamase domain protein [Chlorobium limicola DSM 245]|uniref:Beta-lactamase domain protein n=1 Tax=Chlorobium limicola (strain DSM 245 / NBRC 103803 / 6330) TaxID=290315 RepID=B3ED29_CHLL2|nr:MBL fold metallo-hydrolase [Chlorobium limicola]ACD90454.1 beta-lactamase domain protein [Chlorobium limicola DSM 245]
MMQIGDYRLYSLDVQDFALDGGAMFGVVPKVMWEKHTPSDVFNRVMLKARVLLISGKGRHILVDTGMGTAWSEKLRSIYLLSDFRLDSELQAHGLAPEDITDIIYTHLHFDHVGGSFKPSDDGLQPHFPSARHYVQKENYLSATRPNQKEKVSYSSMFIGAFGQLSGLELIDGPMELFPGIEVFVSNGHTRGQQLVRISDGGRTLVHGSDLVPSSAHLPLPWVMGFDIEPLTVIDEKTALLNSMIEGGEMLYFGHDPFHEAALLKLDEKGAIVVDRFVTL